MTDNRDAAARASRKVIALRTGAATRMQRRGAQDLAAVPVSRDQPGVVRQNVDRKFGPYGKEQPIGVIAILRPLVIAAKILDRRFDFDDPDRAVRPERRDVGTTSVRQGQLRDGREGVRRQHPHHTPANLARGIRLWAAVRGLRNIRPVKSVFHTVLDAGH